MSSVDIIGDMDTVSGFRLGGVKKAEVVTTAEEAINAFDKFLDEFDKLIDECDVLITHGGVGSILNAVKLGKKVIAVPRLAKYNEHVNDHQLQVIKKMTDDGYILSTEDETLIVDKIKEIANFEPKVYTSNTDNFIKGVKNILDDIINS